MENSPLQRRTLLRMCLVTLLAVGGFNHAAWPQDAPVTQSPKSGTVAKVILEVTQWSAIYGYDVGMQHPSYANGSRHFVYLRVFSDRTAEAQNEWDQTMKRTVLTQGEFDKLQYVLDQPDLLSLGLDAKYDLLKDINYPASSMPLHHQTWDAVLQHSKARQKLQIDDFDGYLYDSDRYPHDGQTKPPNVVVKLGCTVEDVRTNITGQRSGREKECQEAFAK